MKKIFLAVIPLALLITGCNANTGERLSDLEKSIEGIRIDLELDETRMNSLEDGQRVLNENYKELAAKRSAGVSSAAVDSMSLQDMQTALNKAGFYNGAIDGKIGPATEAAIKKFQEANGLKADGVAGAQTKSALMKFVTR